MKREWIVEDERSKYDSDDLYTSSAAETFKYASLLMPNALISNEQGSDAQHVSLLPMIESCRESIDGFETFAEEAKIAVWRMLTLSNHVSRIVPNSRIS